MVLMRRRNDKPTMLTCAANAVRNCGNHEERERRVRLSIGRRHRLALPTVSPFAVVSTQRISNARLRSVTGGRPCKNSRRSTEQRGPPNLISVMADAWCKSNAKFRTIKNSEQLRVPPRTLSDVPFKVRMKVNADGRQCSSTSGQSCSGAGELATQIGLGIKPKSDWRRIRRCR